MRGLPVKEDMGSKKPQVQRGCQDNHEWMWQSDVWVPWNKEPSVHTGVGRASMRDTFWKMQTIRKPDTPEYLERFLENQQNMKLNNR